MAIKPDIFDEIMGRFSAVFAVIEPETQKDSKYRA